MKKNTFILSAVLFLFAVSATSLYAQNKESRKTASFSSIELSVPADLYLSQGNLTEVQLEGPADYLAKVETKVSHGNLAIRFYKKYCTWWREPKGRIKIYISTPDLEKLDVTGSGIITAKSKIACDELSLLVTGSGMIELPALSVNELSADVTGSGTIRAAGEETAESQKILITGSGKVLNDGLPAQNTKVSITGSGKARVYATGRLKISVTGSGKVYYKGGAVLDASITGSGDAVKIDER